VALMQSAADGVGLGSRRRGRAGASGTQGVGVIVGATTVTQPEACSASRVGVALGAGVADGAAVARGVGAADCGRFSWRVSSRTATSAMMARTPQVT
jgi:hypothetical protein